MEEADLVEDDFSLGPPMVALIISLLLIAFAYFCLKPLIKKEAKMDITTILVNQPELGIEKARFYLVKNWLDYGLVQFKDAGDDGIMDRVFYSDSEIAFNPDAFDPNTGFPGDNVSVSDPNSADWNKWLKRFDLILEKHAEKIKQQEKLKRQKR